MRIKIKSINRKDFLKLFSKIYIGFLTFINFPFAMKNEFKKISMHNIYKLPKTGPWDTSDPFLFCVHHNDNYPKANDSLGPDKSLEGRQIGNDFSNINGWSMYHGKNIPGFPRHPHRGFETITIVEKGLIDHSDSMGYSARYGDGDVQWLTAGDGIQHSEMFPLLDKNKSNSIDFFQIWINLKSENKRVKPNFSMFWKDEIPKVVIRDKNNLKTEIDIIAGTYKGKNAPSPPPNSWANNKENSVNIWKIKMNENTSWKLPEVELGISRTLYIYRGSGILLNEKKVNSGYMIKLKTNQDILISSIDKTTKILLLQARPINEPIVKYGPFVMNTKAEIQEAFDDYNKTSFGDWTWDDDAPVHGKDYKKFAIGDN